MLKSRTRTFRLPVSLFAAAALWPMAVVTPDLGAADRDTLVKNDRDGLEDSDVWIYNDLDRGFAEARKTGMPLMVVLRCIP